MEEKEFEDWFPYIDYGKTDGDIYQNLRERTMLAATEMSSVSPIYVTPDIYKHDVGYGSESKEMSYLFYLATEYQQAFNNFFTNYATTQGTGNVIDNPLDKLYLITYNYQYLQLAFLNYIQYNSTYERNELNIDLSQSNLSLTDGIFIRNFSSENPDSKGIANGILGSIYINLYTLYNEGLLSIRHSDGKWILTLQGLPKGYSVLFNNAGVAYEVIVR